MSVAEIETKTNAMRKTSHLIVACGAQAYRAE
jgi:hypothetical protein